ncbi:hypothetical protein Droror1_Dr00007044 [Drosera rotundifolia]
MASPKNVGIAILFTALMFLSIMEVGHSARLLLQLPTTLPQPTLPTFPLPGQQIPGVQLPLPSIPQLTFPSFPPFRPLPSVPQLTLPPLPFISFPGLPNIPSTFPSIPFLAPPPSK